MIIFGLILTTFKLSVVFRGSWGSCVNWLEPKTEPPSGNLAWPNPWNALYDDDGRYSHQNEMDFDVITRRTRLLHLLSIWTLDNVKYYFQTPSCNILRVKLNKIIKFTEVMIQKSWSKFCGIQTGDFKIARQPTSKRSRVRNLDNFTFF